MNLKKESPEISATEDTRTMRPRFLEAWEELVKTARGEAPFTDRTKTHLATASLYVKQKTAEIRLKRKLAEVDNLLGKARKFATVRDEDS